MSVVRVLSILRDCCLQGKTIHETQEANLVLLGAFSCDFVDRFCPISTATRLRQLDQRNETHTAGATALRLQNQSFSFPG
jgi:hypothetical protein